MSFRPTITAFANGRIADIGYYRNWSIDALFFEALTIALLYSDCESVEAFRDKKYGTQKLFYILDPEEIENTDEDLQFLISCSEFSVAVDLSAGCIYASETQLSADELSALPSALDAEERRRLLNEGIGDTHPGGEHEPVRPDKLDALRELLRVGGRGEETYFYKLLKAFRFPFRELDRESALELLRAWDGASGHLSCDTYEKLMRTEKSGA